MTTLPILQNIPCTLVTGFLGAGKTSVINQLLAIKAADQRWALLINEFGRIGIDGALVKNSVSSAQIAISEVSGGCICCSSQLPLQIALSRLLSEHRPQRLIIEPTGLAHPSELLRQLSAPHWQTALQMQAVITVLSASQWQQQKYRSHEGFQAHVRDADVVVINRYAQLSAAELLTLKAWINTLNAQVQIIWATSESKAEESSDVAGFSDYLAALSASFNQPSILISQQRAASTNQSRIGLTLPNRLAAKPSTLANNDASLESDNEWPYRYHEQQQAMLVGGWRLPADWVFAADELQEWLLKRPNWQRIKAVIHTTAGWQQFNFTPDSLTISTTSAQTDSRLEIILLSQDNSAVVSREAKQQDIWSTWDRELMALVIE